MMNKQLETLDAEKQQLIVRHVELVIEANKSINLTRIDSLEEALVLHVEDSLAAMPEMLKAPAGLYGDMGSGAGFPGIPLAVATGRKTVLIDARKKKMDAVSGIIAELGLQGQVETYAGRAELLSRSRKGAFSVLTARALSKISVLMELASPLLKTGGQLICYKSALEDSELKDARRVEALTGMKVGEIRKFTLDETYERSIVVIEKVAKPKAKLPRQEGMAQKKPL